jgi:hypothetical protein
MARFENALTYILLYYNSIACEFLPRERSKSQRMGFISQQVRSIIISGISGEIYILQ